MYTLDANIFVRDVDPGEPEHATCQALIAWLRTTSTPIIVPLIILSEVAGAVSRTRRDPMRARLTVELLRDLPNVTLVPLDAALAHEAADVAADYGMRGMDAIYVAVARRYGCPLVTLDDDAQRRAGAVVEVLTPEAALARLNSEDVS